jgi:DNA sulfur modification protein DndB
MVNMGPKWCIPSLRGVLGDWIYYSAMLEPQFICERVRPSRQIREAKALEDFLQRTLKPRVSKIAQYLMRRDSRFFNSIIVGIFEGLPQWAEFDLNTAAAKLGMRDLSELKDNLGLLIFTGNEKMFAIDGQHRVEGIKQAYKKNSKRIAEDQYPAIFVAHLDTPAGKVRTRRLFCDINKNAVAVSEGDKVVIDEDDLSAIATRRIYATYPLFKKGNEIAVTERKQEVVEKDGRERFTSLLAIYTVCKRLKKLYRRPRGTLESALENVEAFQGIVSGFFDFAIMHEPSLNGYFQKKSTTLEAERKNNRSLFFRPVGLEVLARLYGHFAVRNDLTTLAEALQTLPFRNPGGIFDGILWNDGRVEASAKAKKAAVGMCLYILHQLTKAEEAELTEALRNVKKDPDYSLPPRPAPPAN